jgi:hypothetical protein
MRASTFAQMLSDVSFMKVIPGVWTGKERGAAEKSDQFLNVSLKKLPISQKSVA